MKVLVTGGTGFVGSHLVAAAIDAGHHVRMFVRDPHKVERALAPFGAPPVEIARGDLSDPGSIERALVGCDAVVHAANIYSTDPRRRAELTRLNTEGTELVLSLARRAGCDPIIYVSSVVALLPAAGPALDTTTPLGHSPHAYSASKAAGEQVARRHQAEGAPVVITNPGGVYGPHDPGPGEMVHHLAGFLGNRYPFHFFRGGLPIVDVRWLGRLHAALLQRGLGPRRILCGGTFVPWNEMFRILRRLTGRALPNPIPSPSLAVSLLGVLSNCLQAIFARRMPFSAESSWLASNCVPSDDHAAIVLLGEPHPPLEVTLADAIRWCVAQGHLSAARAGSLVRA